MDKKLAALTGRIEDLEAELERIRNERAHERRVLGLFGALLAELLTSSAEPDAAAR